MDVAAAADVKSEQCCDLQPIFCFCAVPFDSIFPALWLLSEDHTKIC